MMGRTVAAGLAVLAAVIGAGTALLVGSVAGLGDSTTTVVEQAAAPSPLPTGTKGTKGTSGAAFDPAALYKARASGVVTIYANLGTAGDGAGVGLRRRSRRHRSSRTPT